MRVNYIRLSIGLGVLITACVLGLQVKDGAINYLSAATVIIALSFKESPKKKGGS